MSDQAKRDPPFDRVPFKQEEFDALRAIHASLPTFRDEDCSIASEELAEMYARWVWPRSTEQLNVYKRYWDTHHAGRVLFPLLQSILVNLHDTGLRWLRDCITDAKRDGDGFIHKDDFEIIYKIYEVTGSFALVKSWDEFVKEADLNADGKVSVEEAIAWVGKHAPGEFE